MELKLISRKSLPTVGLAFGLLVFVGAWGGTFWYAIQLQSTDHQIGTGTFGDAFGAANAGFTGLALVALCISIWVQRRELATAQEDRDATRQALDTQVKINNKLEEDLERRRIEDAFYRIISQAIDLRPAFSYDSNGITETQEKLLLYLQDEVSSKKRVFAPLSIRRTTAFYAALKAAYRIAIKCSAPDEKNHMLQILAESIDSDGLSIIYTNSLIQLAEGRGDDGFQILVAVRHYGFLFSGLNKNHHDVLSQFIDPDISNQLRIE